MNRFTNKTNPVIQLVDIYSPSYEKIIGEVYINWDKYQKLSVTSAFTQNHLNEPNRVVYARDFLSKRNLKRFNINPLQFISLLPKNDPSVS